MDGMGMDEQVVPHYLDNLDEYLRVIREEVAELARNTKIPDHVLKREYFDEQYVMDEVQLEMVRQWKLRIDEIWHQVATSWTSTVEE